MAEQLFLAANPTAEYVDYSLDTAGVKPGELAGLTVVLDAFHGSAGPELWRALTKAGVRVVPLAARAERRIPHRLAESH